MTNTTTKDLRAALKGELGLNARAVSVRATSGGSINVTIKDAGAKFGEVEEVANRFRSVRYCHASGEILSGGNTFVSVSWSAEAKAVRGARYIDIITAAAAKVDAAPSYGHRIGGTDLMLWKGTYGSGYDITGNTARDSYASTLEEAASSVANMLDELATAAA